MPNIAIIGSRGYPSYYGGFETLVRRLAPFLVDAGWDVTVYGRPGIKTDDPGRDPRVMTKTTRGVESKSLSTLSYSFTSVVDAAAAKPDVALLLNCATGYWLPMLKARGIPTLVNVDGLEWERAKWNRMGKTVFKTGAKMTAAWADRLVFDAKEIGRRWHEDFHRDGVFIPYGGTPAGEELPVEPGLEHGRYALLVARFVEENTISPFVEAAHALSERMDVVFVGSSGYGGDVEASVARLAAESPRVHWFGHVKDDRRLAALWQHAGAYFHGHSVGGTNPALVQAMALGAPIVARDTVYNREVLHGSGLMVPPEAGAIARAVEGLVNSPDLQAQLGWGAQARANDIYTWDRVCGAYELELRALLKPVAVRVPLALPLPASASPRPARLGVAGPAPAGAAPRHAVGAK
jgi:glycosyltransferase involved in cell wall biosynthesis